MRTITYTKALYGKTIDIVIDRDYCACNEQLDIVIEYVYTEALRLQKIFNIFDPKSELSQLNTKRDVVCSSPLLELIQLGLTWTQRTKGDYDITIGRKILQRKQHQQVNTGKSHYDTIEIIGDRVVLTHPDSIIDLGSIAKGYIADQIAKLLIQHGCHAGLIDARGDIITFGDYKETLDVQDPRNEDKEIAAFTLQNMGVATSGDYMQYDTTYTQSHILHQKTYSSVTVLAPTLTQADLLATVLFVSNDVIKNEVIAQYPEVTIMTVDKENTIEVFNDPYHKIFKTYTNVNNA